MNHIVKFILLGVVALSLTGAGQATSTVVIAVRNIQNPKGQMYISLCRKDEFMTQQCYKNASRKIRSKAPVLVKFPNIAYGMYAVQVLHDVNENKKLDMDLDGIPKEPTGVSGPRAQSGIPRFDKSAVKIAKPITKLVVKLQ